MGTDKTNFSWLYFLAALAVLLNFSGLFVTIMAPDGALYAGIAKTMVLRHNYTDLYAEGRDWLDKPHFPFWMAALSFKMFGFKTWAYKLPAVLFVLMGAWYTYLLGKSLYNKEIGLWAALILLTAEHIIISNTDVRAEPYLTGLVIASVYYFYKAKNSSKWFLPLLFACVFAACAVMTKGIFALIPIGSALAGEMIITKQWNQLFNVRWLVAFPFILIFIVPELYSIYRQFDLHPEKVVFGHTGVSGLRFFFWDSQFGRFFNTGPIKGSGDPFFFVHTTLWAFLPWSLLLFAAVFQFIKKNRKKVMQTEWYCISGALFTFLVFSASKFQLPFYTNIIYPFFAIIAAQYLVGEKQKISEKAVAIIQHSVVVIMLVIIGVLQYFFRPQSLNWPVAILLSILILMLVFLPGKMSNVIYRKVAMRCFLAACVVNVYFNLAFYPSLLHYQAGSEAAFYINQNNNSKLPVVQCIGDYGYPLEFYLNQPLFTVDENGFGKLPPKPFLMYVPANNLQNLKAKGWEMKTIKTFDRYWITKLTPAFINFKSREATLEKQALVLVN